MNPKNFTPSQALALSKIKYEKWSLEKSVILVGPSGVGKTTILEHIDECAYFKDSEFIYYLKDLKHLQELNQRIIDEDAHFLIESGVWIYDKKLIHFENFHIVRLNER